MFIPDARRAEAERMMAIQSTANAGLQMLLAVHAEGLGAVWTCAPLFTPEVVRATLDLPISWEPQGMFFVGYPAEIPDHVKENPFRKYRAFYMKIVALAGGVGGAKLVDGLARVLAPEDLTVVVNTGDDFEHLGLYICPDLDTICYTLAGMANPETGWGRSNETWKTMENLKKLGGPGWFQLGDQDFATHLERTRRLRENQPFSQIVREFCQGLGNQTNHSPHV